MKTKPLFCMALKLAATLWLTALNAAPAQAAVEAWVQRYNGPGNGDDQAVAVAVDGNGNVFVTGYSYGIVGSNDYLTIKYSSAGTALWTNGYNGAGNGDDSAYAVAVDGSGNVFVTGSSDGGGFNTDYATIKYSGTGVPLWTNRYNGPGNSADSPVAVAVDGSGNAFVTGSSIGSGSSNDYATIKYSGPGVPLWTNRYNGPGNGIDQARAMALDSNGDMFVTGSSDGGGGSSDYATIKYSGAGVPMWTNHYIGPGNADFPSAVAVDGSGNVFVTGFSFSGFGFINYDYATIKYSGAGVPLWTNRYNGLMNDYDQANAVAVDGSGNAFVTGYSTGSSSYRDYATIKYSGAGVPLWTNRYNGPGNGGDYARAVEVDGSGNAFVAGYSTAGGSGYDYVTIAYSGAGVPLWTNRYNGPANGNDQPQARSCLAIGPDGSVYVTGASDGDYTSGTKYDYATVKYVNAQPYLTIEPDGGGGYFLRIHGIGGTAYRLQRATSVNGSWLSSPAQTAPASGLVEFWDIFPPPDKAFYRTVQE